MNKSKEAYERAVFVISTTGGTAHDVDPITGYVIELEARIAELTKIIENLIEMYYLQREKYNDLKLLTSRSARRSCRDLIRAWVYGWDEKEEHK